MNNHAIIERLDLNIDALLLAAPPEAGDDRDLAELISVARELHLYPRETFREALRAKVLSQPAPQIVRVQTHVADEQILPTLFQQTQSFNPRGFGLSLAAHAALLLLLFTSGLWMVKRAVIKQEAAQVIELSPYTLPPAKDTMSGGGGGGEHDKTPAPQGALPRSALRQITPPQIVVKNESPKLPVEPTVALPIQLPQQQLDLGDPMSHIPAPPTNGTGIGGGVGNGSGTGIGSGAGEGVGPGVGGGVGGGLYHVGGGVRAPRALYDPDPDYSEEARKARYQGTVVLALIVDQSGRPTNIHVVRSLGYGLDEKAIERVKTWKFSPATKDGLPVAVQINLEINFHMY